MKFIPLTSPTRFPIHRDVAILVGLLFLSTLLTAQVKICEKVEITPIQGKSYLNSSSPYQYLFTIEDDIYGPNYPYIIPHTRFYPRHITVEYSLTIAMTNCDPYVSLCLYPSICDPLIPGWNANGHYEGSFEMVALDQMCFMYYGMFITSLTLNSTSDTAIVQCEYHSDDNYYGSAAGTIKIFLTPNQVDYVDLFAIPDTISYNEHSTLSFIARDWYGNELMLGDNVITDFAHWDDMPTPIGRIFPEGIITYKNAKDSGVFYYADQTAPTDVEEVNLRLFINDGYGDAMIVVNPLCPVVLFSEEEISPGDSVVVTIMGKNDKDEIIPFPSGQKFEISMTEGTVYGALQLLDGGSMDTILSDAPYECRFIANSEISEDSVAVEIQALPKESSGSLSMGNKMREPLFSIQGNSVLRKQGINKSSRITGICDPKKKLPIKTNSGEILLGESKYYYVKNTDGKYSLEETTNPSSTPDKVTDVIWGENPIALVTENITNPGKKLGVYWEKGKPLPGGGTLPNDMIRLIGRYWHADSVYKVRLSITRNSQELKKIIEVKKPGKLIDWNNDDVKNGIDFGNGNDYSQTNDIYGNPLNIDEMIIEIAGREGIPPQYIKGQMYRESYRGGAGDPPRFYPSYRYEPGIDYDIQNYKDKKRQYLWSGYPFVVTLDPNSMGGTLPTNHTNVKPYDYQRYPVTISQYIGSRIDQYYQRDKNNSNRIKFLGRKVGEELTMRWETYYDRYRKYFLDLSNSFASSLSLTLTETDLILGRVRPGFNVAAQTRIVASYGLLQMTHYTATDKRLNGYIKTAANKLPENLNDHRELMPAYVEFTVKNMKRPDVLGDSPPLSNWNDGFEGAWLKIAGWYNPLSKPTRYNIEYGRGVINNSKLFLPQR